MITVTLFALAMINVLTKKVATISGVSFTIAVLHRLRAVRYPQPQAQGRARSGDGEVPAGSARRPFRRTRSACGRATCWWRCAIPTACSTCGRILEKTDTRKIDIVVLSVRRVTQAASGEHALDSRPDFLRRRNHRLHARGHAGGEGGQARRADGGARLGPLRGRGADGRAPAILAHRDGAVAQAHAFRAGRAGRATTGSNCPSRGLRCRWRSFSRTRRTRCSSTWARIRRACGRRISICSTGSGWSWAPGPGAKLHHRDIVGVALRRMNAELHSDLPRKSWTTFCARSPTATTTSRQRSA